MQTRIRKSVIAAVAALALTTAGTFSAPSDAHANEKLAGALIGGLIVGTIIGAHSRPVYAQPYYHAPAYRPVYRPVRRVVRHRCHWERQRVWDEYDGGYFVQKVKVCY